LLAILNTMMGDVMTNWKHALLVAASALAAMAALALPASASASVWLREGKPLAEQVELSLTGGEVLEVGGSSLLCEASATMTTEGGSTAQVTAYNVLEASCLGLAGELEGCEVTAATPAGLPWSVTVNSVDLTAHGVGIGYSFNEACPIHKIETGFPELTLTPEEPSAIRNFHFSQEGIAKVDGEEATLDYTGVLQLPEEDFDIYGIG
jgi:hypothetical protein